MNESNTLDQLPGALAKAESLPSPPTVAVEVLRVTNDVNSTVEDLTRVLSHDPALSAKVLKLANSPLFRRGAPVTSLDRASMRLGAKTVKLMALSFSLTNGLPRKVDTPGFDYDVYWSRSLTMAVAGRALARLVGSSTQDEAFLCGLLGRLGQLVMAQSIPDDYAAVLERNEGELPSAELESEMLSVDFHQVGAALLRTWELPLLIWQTIGHWGDPASMPEDLNEDTRTLAKTMHLADLTAALICNPRKGCTLQSLYRLGAEYLGVSEEELNAFVMGLEEDVSEMASMLDVDVDQDSYQSIVDQAHQEIVQISLGTALDLEQTHSRAEELERENQLLADRASTDALTGIPNRAHFDQALEKLVRARLTGGNAYPLGVLMVDVDHFKNFNDTYGHQVGDEVLKLVANALKEATRDTDLAARYGGEEFVVIVPGATSELLQTVAERVRERIGAQSLEHGGASLSVTASVGGACVDRIRAEEDGIGLIAQADALLYEAKEAGRNRSCCRRVEL